MPPHPADLAEQLHHRALTEQNAGRHGAALRLLTRARRALDTLDAQELAASAGIAAAVAISVALNEAELSGVERGLDAMREARRLAEAARSPALLVRAHNQTGLIASRAGRWHLAALEFEQALGLLDEANDNDRYSVLLNLGTLRMMRGDLAGARPLLQRAVDFARERRLAASEMKALHNLGYLDYLRGDLPSALRLMDEADRLPVDVSRGVLLLDRSRVLLDAGLLQEADATLLAAHELFRSERLAQDVGETELERARCALVQGDVAAARRLAARARDRFRRRGNDQSRRAAELVLLQGDLAAGRPGRRLVGPALRLRDELHGAGLAGAARTAGLLAAEAELAAGSAGAAARVLADLGTPSRRDPVTARLHHHLVQARVDDASGRRSAARARIGRALGELAAYQSTFGSIDLATAAAVHGRRLAALDLEIALRDGRPHEVFDAAERSRAVTARSAAVTPPDDAELGERLSELRQVVESARAVFDPQALARLDERRVELERIVSERRWTLTGSGATRPPCHVDEVAAALDGSTLVSLVQSRRHLHAVVVGGGATALVDLGPMPPVLEAVRRVRADLDVLAQPRLPAPLRVAVHASYTRSLTALDRTLLGALGIDGRLVISATGVLGQLPWSDLPSRRGRATVVSSSATGWLTAQSAAPSGTREIAAFAGPDVGSGVAEVAGVHAHWPHAAVTVGTEATGESLTKAMATADLVHIAAHGTHQTENPLFSCLRMADGPVFAHEFDHLGRAPEHVVLSACELGLATVRPGDEALGLTSVLLRLGTRSVIAGVARVADGLAATTMTAYHRRLAAGDDSATALAGALAANDPDQPAPFVCFGAAWWAQSAQSAQSAQPV
ncbi:MAG: CHAT domain-containing protein [Jatrophihabitans sp.]|uniref:CHAT domain-containing protein n=1 Tax=Jatrophihabitans sp. TaxID=1932789 RepID=UPI003F7DAA24